ncbi:MAG: hypothetical protein RL226_83 [Bacteroidota bacterium]
MSFFDMVFSTEPQFYSFDKKPCGHHQKRYDHDYPHTNWAAPLCQKVNEHSYNDSYSYYSGKGDNVFFEVLAFNFPGFPFFPPVAFHFIFA